MMSNLPASLAIVVGALLVGCSSAGNTTNTARADSPQHEAARSAFAAADYDEALRLTDAIRAADADDLAAWRIAAEANGKLFESGRSGAQFLLFDAIESWQRVAELDPKDGEAWLALADLHRKNSNFEAGVLAGQRAFDAFTAAKAPAARRAAAAIAIADNQMQVFVTARRTELEADSTAKPEAETMGLANRVLTTVEGARQLGAIADAARRGAMVCQWLGRDKDAIDYLERGIVADPSATVLHDMYREAFVNNGSAKSAVGAYTRLLRASPDNAYLHWYLGRAHIDVADAARRAGDVGAAERAYADARASFDASEARRADFASSCGEWRAICELALGRLAFEKGDLETAASRYAAAFAASEAVANYDDVGRPQLQDGLGRHYLGNVFLLGTKFAEGESLASLEKSLEYWESVLARHPGKFGILYNNAALAARDLGELVVAQQADGDDMAKRTAQKRALTLWETSYRHYCQAVELEPDDARIVNDCGLMLVYYLKRDYAKARALFDRAIELGQPHVDALAADASADERRFREESVGDAYQNIGVLLRQLGKPADEIRPFFEKALEYAPYAERESTQYLEELDAASEATHKTRFEPQDPAPRARPELDQRIAEASAKADDQDWDGALLLLDKLAKQADGYAPFHRQYGLYSLRYAQESMSSGGNAGLVSGLFADALRQLERAVELDGSAHAARTALLDAAMASGAFANAEAAARQGLARKDLDAELRDAWTSVRGLAAARAYAEAKQADRDADDMLQATREAFSSLEAQRALTAAERDAWVNAERWGGAAGKPVDILVRALAKTPDDQALLNQLVETAQAIAAEEKAVTALRDRKDAVGVWYLGRALWNVAQTQWSGGKPEQAIESLDAGVAAFEKASKLNDDFRASCEQWIAYCLGSKGLVQASQSEDAAAEKSLLAALDKYPDGLTASLGSSSIKRGLLVVGDRYLQANELGKVADLYIEIGKRAPDDVDLANNEGLFCRDYGVQLTRRGGDAKRAEPYFEASYAAYTRASNGDPSNVRLRNDRALLLIYHLDRELELARQLLEGGIADGEKMLADAPPEDATELRDLNEAVGDCYENLGFLHMQKDDFRDYAKARAALQKSITYYPFERRASSRHLQRLEGLERGDRK